MNHTKSLAGVLAASFATLALLPCQSFAQRGDAQSAADFRLSLTATVVSFTSDGRATQNADALGCQVVHLKWRARTGATGYLVYSSPSGDGQWTPLPATTACGVVRQASPTSVLDAEPTRGGATVLKRLYYKVAAMDGNRLIESSDVIPVELSTGR